MLILFATTRGAGHVGPLVPFAHACVRAGHDVLVAGPGSAAPLVGRARLAFRAVGEPPPAEVAAAWAQVWSPDSAPGAAHVIRDLFIGLAARAALPGMLTTMEAWRPDVVVHESCEFASVVAAEQLGVPRVQFGIHLSAQTDADELFFAIAAPALDELRADFRLAPGREAEAARRPPIFTLAPRALEDPAAPEPERLRRFQDPAAMDAPARPAWLPRGMIDAPLVYVSFGSEAPATGYFPRLYRAAIDALAELPARILVTIGDKRDPAELGPLPPSVRVERWVSQAAVMPHAAAVVGHGGSGSTLLALAAGVPMALVPLFVDGPDNARRVSRAGAGIALEGGADAAVGLGEAVGALLADPRYRAAAGRVAAEIRALPPIDDAVGALETIAGDSAVAA